MTIDYISLVEEFQKMRTLPSEFDAQGEMDHFKNLIDSEAELQSTLADYASFRSEGAGGSGLVFSAVYQPFGTRRAIKVPRKRIYEASPTNQDLPRVDPELDALSKVSHQNITRLHQAVPLGGSRGNCIITEYVEEPSSLDEYARQICCSDACKESELKRTESLHNLAQIVYFTVDALHYMNSVAKLIHFDVKPLNILVAKDGRPFVTDLGFARDVTKYNPDDEVEVGFTWKYAHPDLLDPSRGARVSHTAAKSRNKIPGSKITSKIDVFAFGRCLQETLFGLKEVYGDGINSDYTFNYLHLIACLCLDGRNSAEDSDKDSESFVSDRALGMPQAVFKKAKYESFSDVKHSLERLLGLVRLEDVIPELDPWAKSTINVSDLGITTMTDRMRSLWEHPTVERLSMEMQLGMLDTVFPTATHSRIQHSLGTFHAVCKYITSLYYDPENPTFRVLFTSEDCRKTLIASLIHDLGHTNFGHDLEEVDKEEFSHNRIGWEIIESDHVLDSKNRSLRQIIEGTDLDCWDVKAKEVKSLLEGKSVKPLDGVFQDILDGQLDADKLDYLIRDSVECRIPYGRGIDYERFLRSLTTIATGNNENANLRLAIKRKGAASAEAFAFARYQLYQSLYWHHTFRAIKSMLLSAAANTFKNLREQALQGVLGPNPFRSAYVSTVIGIPPSDGHKSSPKRSSKSQGNDIQTRIQSLLTSANPPLIGKYADDKTLQFLWKLSDGKARTLISDLMSRRYYKRVIEIPLGELNEEQWFTLRKRFEGNNRIDLQDSIEETLTHTLVTSIQDQITTRESLARDNVLETIMETAAQRYLFLPDLPLRGWMASGEDPIFVSDYKRRHFRTSVGLHLEDKSGSLWSDLGTMMRRIAFFRVFCEPTVHNLITRVMKPSQIRKALGEQFAELKSH